MQPLPQFYLITPDIDVSEPIYLQCIEESLQQGIRLIQFRSKQLSQSAYIKLANRILILTRAYQAQLLIQGPAPLLAEVPADGIHLSVENYKHIDTRPVKAKYLLSLSCHNAIQLQQAHTIGADLAVLGPIFKTPSCPQGIAMGWDYFSQLVRHIGLSIYALGGLTIKDYQIAKKKGAYGIAAKRALWALKTPLIGILD